MERKSTSKSGRPSHDGSMIPYFTTSRQPALREYVKLKLELVPARPASGPGCVVASPVTSKLDYAHNQISRYPFRKIRFLKREIRFYNYTLTFTAIVRLLPHFLHFNHVLRTVRVSLFFGRPPFLNSQLITLLRK